MAEDLHKPFQINADGSVTHWCGLGRAGKIVAKTVGDTLVFSCRKCGNYWKVDAFVKGVGRDALGLVSRHEVTGDESRTDNKP
jgi:hypothetical protein